MGAGHDIIPHNALIIAMPCRGEENPAKKGFGLLCRVSAITHGPPGTLFFAVNDCRVA